MAITPATAIVQARMGSTRLPGKVLREILGRPMLWYIIRRLRSAARVEQVVVATSDLPADAPIREFCALHGVPCFAGSENDVLDRFYRAAMTHGGDPLVRITADCPFVDPAIVDALIGKYDGGDYDYLAVATGAGAIFLKEGRFPDGLDAECFSVAALERAWREASHGPDREHVTPYIWRNKDLFRTGHLLSGTDHSALRWTVDTEADFELVRRVYEALYKDDASFSMDEILALVASHPELAALNREFVGKEGYRELWDAGASSSAGESRK